MTDMSLEAPHGAGWTARPAREDVYGARLAARRREHRAYFVVLLILALPLELLAWPLRALAALAGGTWPPRGPLRAAWSHAALVTPIILSA